ncbi:hypothetical protein NQ314_019479 [Rhamnusium bicolor]|uniref:Uncharacterized protein n=1 Tax=Rhamnusium bicolor TaxID=1586634 RepID=A0AAV8WNB4_9CUCU|nr:hypothetical protein NQ314_019479 [Rhamnusium bicolor]
MKEFSELCGAKRPESLRGTNLHKQIATHSVIYNLSDAEVSDLANFMGHHEKIHKKHYRMPIIAPDITRMSRLLEMAQGGISSGDTEKESEDNLEESEIFNNIEQN